FNVGWTVGILGGQALAGYHYALLGPRWALWTIALLVWANGLYLAWRTRHGMPAFVHAEGPDVSPHETLSVGRRAGYLRMAWIANFTLWFAGSAVGTVFPKLGRTLHFSDGLIGLLLSVTVLWQAISFAGLSRWSRWHYRLGPLVAAQVMAAGGLWLIAVQPVSASILFGFALLGLSRGLSYSCSLYYGLDGAAMRGVNSGIHEAIVGIAYILGPLLAGFSADLSGLRTPYLLCAIVVLLGVGVEGVLWRRLPAYTPPQEPAPSRL
ncbi:MAG TPA: MFS transporter, partial [Armatimonadota bacterium]